MKIFFLSMLSICLLASCSNNPNNNGGTNATVVPVAPTNLFGSVSNITHVNLTWTDNAKNEIGYKVQRKTGNGNYADVASTGADVTNYSDVGLTPITTYMYRVYAYNGAGNSPSYSNEVTVTTGATVANLPSATICNQIWTIKNLDVSTYKNGDIIPQVKDATQWANLTTGAWCWYNNDSATYWQYGKLYNWYSVNDPRGLAPQGWHVPTDAEWNQLIKCIDPFADITFVGYLDITAGAAMKETGTSHWPSPNTEATNSTGFTGLPGGNRRNDGSFLNIGYYGFWWSSTEINTTNNAWEHALYNNVSGVARYYYNKSHGFSIRLVKD